MSTLGRALVTHCMQARPVLGKKAAMTHGCIVTVLGVPSFNVGTVLLVLNELFEIMALRLKS